MTIDAYRAVKIRASHANDVLPPIRISANDHDGREILFELWDGDSAVVGNELSAKLIYTTADGTGSYINLSKTTSDGTVAFTGPFPEEMFGVEYGAFAVQITDGTDIVTTLRVPYKVDAQLINEDSPVAQDALSEFRSAVQALDNLLPATTTRLGTIKVGNGLSAANDGTLNVDLSTSNLPTVPISKGGTGGTTAKEGQYNLLNNMAEITADASDDTYILGTHTTAGTSNGFAAKRKLSNIWSYIVGKIRTVFGFNSSNVLAVSNGGTGATAAADARENIGAFSNTGGQVQGDVNLDTDALDDENLPSSVTTGRVLRFRGKNSSPFGFITSSLDSLGRHSIYLTARNVVNGANIDNNVRLMVLADGTRAVTLSSKNAWWAALGFDHVESGQESIEVTTAGTTGTATVTFGTQFPSAPFVNFYLASGVPKGKSVSILSRSASGFKIYLYSDTAGTFNVGWWAFYIN